jgi:hypothetical protein
MNNIPLFYRHLLLNKDTVKHNWCGYSVLINQQCSIKQKKISLFKIISANQTFHINWYKNIKKVTQLSDGLFINQ